jgi:RNA-splicing ligase RtcB
VSNMKKIKKRNKNNKITINTSPSIKMSELIVEYASDYINLGETTEEMQNYLNGACTAWNIANLPDRIREKALRQAAEKYLKMNPGIKSAENYLHDMKILIQKKLQMFPNIRKTIVNAFVEQLNDDRYRINVISTNDPKAL